MSHESFERHGVVQSSSDRVLGLVFGAAFLVIGLMPLVVGAPARVWSVVVAIAFVLIALVLPRLLSPLNRVWTRFGLLLHRITSPIVLGIMFFGVVTPIGLLMRALGKDVLKLRRQSDATTYWVNREPPGPKPETLPNQF
jgi:hypothetical protein